MPAPSAKRAVSTSRVVSSQNRPKSPNTWGRGDGSRSRVVGKENRDAASSFRPGSSSHTQLPFKPSGPKMEIISPSSSPARSKYWYGQSRTASGNNQQTFGRRSVSPHDPRPATEHGERYVEWDLPNRQASPPRPSISNLHSYAVAMNTADWKSENQSSFTNQGRGTSVDPAELRAAGRASRDFGDQVTPTGLIARTTEALKIEPANARGGVVRQHSAPKQRLSEHDGKFQWPVRDVYAPSQALVEMGLEGKHYKGVGGVDYEQKLAELRRKQRQLQPPQPPQPPAGKPSKGNSAEEELPMESKYYPYDMGTSEYKMKFKEWAIPEPTDSATDGSGKEKNASRIFPTNAGDAYADLRQSSLYRDSFPAYHEQAMHDAVPHVDGRAKEGHKPSAFAWSLVDGEKPDIPREIQNPAYSQMGESEYTRRFAWPTAENLHEQGVSQKGGSRHGKDDQIDANSLANTLFPRTEQIPGVSQPLLSEYRAQFDEKDVLGQDKVVRATPSNTTKRDSDVPTQFAWGMLDGPGRQRLEDEEDADFRPRRLMRPVTTDLSEHTNKYKWPVGSQVHSLVRKPDENHERKVGKVFAVDDSDDVTPKGWATEYDEKYHLLRRKQQLLQGNKSSFVAGAPTPQRFNIPANFAWNEALPVPPRSAPAPQPIHVPPEHFNTEYEEKFLAWKSAPAEPVKRVLDGANEANSNRLNLFEEMPTKHGNPANRDRLHSEYDDRFKFFVPQSGTDRSASPGKPHSDAPPQFAWPLVDHRPPSPVQSNKPVKPTGKSEYETKFAWPTQVDVVKSFKPGKDPQTSSGAPMALDDDKADRWQSEYDAKASKAVAQKREADKPIAGIITVSKEDVPSFFAWADAEAQKGKQPVVIRPPEVPTEVVDSEYHDKFKKFRANSIQPAQTYKPTNQEATNASNFLKDDEAPTDMRSEYQAKFPVNAVVSAANNQSAAGIEREPEAYRPPQFAWPRVDAAPSPVATKSVPKKDAPRFTESTEYDSRYLWPKKVAGENDRPNAATLRAKSAATADHFESSATLFNDKQKAGSGANAADWRSEYDDRCAETVKRQQALTISEKEKGQQLQRKNAQGEERPSFFAWQPKEEEKEAVFVLPVPSQTLYPTETTEYREQFLSWTDLNASLPAEQRFLAGSQPRRPATGHNLALQDHVGPLLKDPEVAQPEPQQKSMVTEYDANFTPAVAQAAAADHYIVSQKDYLRPSLLSTNLDKFTPMLPAPPLIERKVNPAAAQRYQTEYSSHYHWPSDNVLATANAAAKALAPELTTHKMKPEYVAAKKSINHRQDANKENLGSTINSAVVKPALKASTTSHTTGTTEYRRQFSWPEPGKAPNDVATEHKDLDSTSKHKVLSPAAAKKQRMQQKAKRYRLMARGVGSPVNQLVHTLPHDDGKDHCEVRSPTFGRAERFPGSSNLMKSTASSRHKQQEQTSSSRQKQQHQSSSSNKQHRVQHQDKNSDNDSFDDLVSAFEHDLPPHQSNQQHFGESHASTVISQDSLMPPTAATVTATNVSRPSTAATSTTIDTAGSQVQARLTERPQPPPAGRALSPPAVIPGLREEEVYRSRSAPPRRHLGLHDSSLTKSALYVDNSASNPVLMHRRYPGISDRQTTRWSTETGDNFNWKATRPRVLSGSA